MLVSLLFLTVFICQGLAQSPNCKSTTADCTGIEIGVFPSCIACKNFIICLVGSSQLGTCPDGQEYDPILSNCVLASMSNCAITTSSITTATTSSSTTSTTTTSSTTSTTTTTTPTPTTGSTTTSTTTTSSTTSTTTTTTPTSTTSSSTTSTTTTSSTTSTTTTTTPTSTTTTSSTTTSTTTSTTMTTTTKKVLHPVHMNGNFFSRGCINQCAGMHTGFYHLCTRCQDYIYCQDGRSTTYRCRWNMNFDSFKRRCTFFSNTCRLSYFGSTYGSKSGFFDSFWR